MDIYESIVLDDSPVGFWRLDDGTSTTAVDRGTHGDGTWTDAPAETPDPLRTSSVTAVEVSSGYLELGDGTDLRLLSAFTVEAWYQTSQFNPQPLYVWDPDGFMMFATYDSGIMARLTFDTGAVAVTTGGNATGAGWHYAAATWDDTTNMLSVYYDGELGASDTLTSDLAWPSTGTAAIGRGNLDLYGFDFQGKLANVAVYPTVLSAPDIAERWNRGLPSSKWINSTDMAVARASPVSAVVGTKLYVIGGEAPSDIVATNEAYDFTTKTWAVKASMPAARAGAAACALGGKIYVSGGTAPDFSLVGDFYRYDPTLNSWVTLTSLPWTDQTSSHTMAPSTSQNKIYVFSNGEEGGVYDVASNTWDTFTQPSGWYLRSAAEYGDKIYLHGGGFSPSGWQALTTTMFDPATLTFTDKTDSGNFHMGGLLLVVDGKLWAIGGNTGSVVDSYDPTLDEWTNAVTTMILPRFNPAAGALNRKVLAAGGYEWFSGMKLASTEEFIPPPMEVGAIFELGLDLYTGIRGRAGFGVQFSLSASPVVTIAPKPTAGPIPIGGRPFSDFE